MTFPKLEMFISQTHGNPAMVESLFYQALLNMNTNIILLVTAWFFLTHIVHKNLAIYICIILWSHHFVWHMPYTATKSRPNPTNRHLCPTSREQHTSVGTILLKHWQHFTSMWKFLTSNEFFGAEGWFDWTT